MSTSRISPWLGRYTLIFCAAVLLSVLLLFMKVIDRASLWSVSLLAFILGALILHFVFKFSTRPR